MITQDLGEIRLQCASIDPFNLPSVSSSNINLLPEVTAVYFLVRKRCVLYIGKAKNLRKRWQGHHKKDYAVRFGDTQISWALMPSCAHALAAERILIDEFMPQLNGYVPDHLKPKAITPEAKKTDQDVEAQTLRKSLESKLFIAANHAAQYIDNAERIIFYVQNDYQTSLRKTMAWLEEISQHQLIKSSTLSCEIHVKWNDLMTEFTSLFKTFESCFLLGDYGLVSDVQLEFEMDSYPILHGFHQGVKWCYPAEDMYCFYECFHDAKQIEKALDSMEESI